jgi:hypothetical protein
MMKIAHAGLAAGVCAAVVAATPVDIGPDQVRAEVRLTAASEGATVLTFEGGLIGLQPFFNFTPLQLQGSLCDAPNVCKPVYYPALPVGLWYNKLVAPAVTNAIAGLPAGTQAKPFGHSQGGQIIYQAIRDWVANPTADDTPSPDRVSWVSIGNPENAFGGTEKKKLGLPPDTPYHGIEVIKQYDGWADAPDGPFNLLSWLNAQVGKSTTHVWGYFDIDLDSPDNILYTPEKAPGVPGNITYVFVPNDTLPLIEMTGILAPLLNPILDPILRPIVESGYNRPIGPVPAPAPKSSASLARNAAAVLPASPVRAAAGSQGVVTDRSSGASEDVVADSSPEVEVLNNGGAHQDDEQDQRHRRGAADRRGAESLRINPVRNKVGAAGRAAAGQRVNGVENLRGADDSGH